MSVTICMRLLNGCTANASPYVTTPSPSPAGEPAKIEVGPDAAGVHQRDLGAAAAPGRCQLRVGDEVAQGGLTGRRGGPGDVAVIVPTGRLATGADLVTAIVDDRLRAGSGVTVRVTILLSATTRRRARRRAVAGRS